MSLLDDFKERANVFWYLEPINAKKVKNKDHWEITGRCPINPNCTNSTTVLTIRSPGTKFYCRKFKHGGGPIDALALKHGIIQCSELGKGYTKNQWGEIIRVIDEELKTVLK